MDSKPLDYEALGVEPPKVYEHGVTIEDIRANMKQAVCTNWRLVGNILHCDTDLGPLAQTIPPDYVLRGVDENNLPILTKLNL